VSAELAHHVDAESLSSGGVDRLGNRGVADAVRPDVNAGRCAEISDDAVHAACDESPTRTVNRARREQRASLNAATPERANIDRVVIPPDGLLRLEGNLWAMLDIGSGRRPVAGVNYVGHVGCGGPQPPVLAAVERGGVRACQGSGD